MKVNPILLEVFKNRFSSIAEEMGVTLNRTGFSPNIKERRDFSCAVFNRDGDMVA
jgi:N-methylhydantoinase B